MEFDPNDMLQAIAMQRNSALDENAKLAAAVQNLIRKMENLQKQLDDLKPAKKPAT